MIKAVKDSSYHFVAWSNSGQSYIRTGTYNGWDLGIDQVWQFEKSSGNLYYVKNWWCGLYMELLNGNYANGTEVGIWEKNGGRFQQWFIDRNNNGSVTFVVHEPNWSNQIDWALDSTGSLGSNCIIYEQAYEYGNWTNGMGSSNVNQQWWLDYADFYFDVNPDDNEYGTSYSNGARVKSFDLKATVNGRERYNEKGLEDYCRREIVTAIYEITNVAYRDGFSYKDYTLSDGEMLEAAEDGTYFKVKHSIWKDISLSINTQETRFEPPAAPTKSVKITD